MMFLPNGGWGLSGLQIIAICGIGVCATGQIRFYRPFTVLLSFTSVSLSPKLIFP
ncbi:hypothetical protein KCP70_12695 [Salmonella enterica subsp. enterica]|nr:hypothetical protein KCP70_12695 [Salmonella enterica subsp. enterica]